MPLPIKPVKLKKTKSKHQARSFTQRVARDANATKLKKLDLLYEEWSRVATIVSDKAWALFQAAGDLPRELRSSGDPSAPLYAFPPTSLVSSMLVASTALPWQTACAAQKDCMLAQAKGALQAWASNLDNRFNQSIQRIRRLDSKYERLAHELSWINANHVWGLDNPAQNLKLRQLQAQQIIKTQALHDPKLGAYQLPANVMSLRSISPQATRYARSLYMKYLQWAKPPSSANQPLMANINSVTRATPSRSKFKYFSHWVNLSSLERGSRIVLPLERNPYLDKRARPGIPFNSTLSIIKNDKGVYLFKLTQNWTVIEEPTFKTEVLGIDLGLKTLLASSQGDLLGDGLLNRLYQMDALYQKLFKKLQKAGKPPSEDAEFRNLAHYIRCELKAFIRHHVKQLIARRLPALVRIENLNFSQPSDRPLSKRMHRLLRNFGQAEFEKTLSELSFEFGFQVEKVASAYTSQTCKRCGFCLPANRNQQKFRCLACGHSSHADVNAACNIARRSCDDRASTPTQRNNIWTAVLKAWLVKNLQRIQITKPGVQSSIVGDTFAGLRALLTCKASRQKLGPSTIRRIEQLLAFGGVPSFARADRQLVVSPTGQTAYAAQRRGTHTSATDHLVELLQFL